MLPPKVVSGHGDGVGTVAFCNDVQLVDEVLLLLIDVVVGAVTEILVALGLVDVEETGVGFKLGQICSIADITVTLIPAIEHLVSVH